MLRVLKRVGRWLAETFGNFRITAMQFALQLENFQPPHKMEQTLLKRRQTPSEELKKSKQNRWQKGGGTGAGAADDLTSPVDDFQGLLVETSPR